ncbi:MAG: HEPN domain-containing protein [Desulfobacteraceae bacterium]|nr:MAG: HEPN domain-containing protein [Desulfobacteraceae bacterium]
MKTPEREAIRWMQQSEDDFKFVQWLSNAEMFFDKGCFIAQQAGEKACKACLYAIGRRRILGHSIYELSQALSEQDGRFAALLDDAKQLDRFYIPTRYPNGIPGGSPFQVFDHQDLKNASDSLERIMTTCRNFLNEKNITH